MSANIDREEQEVSSAEPPHVTEDHQTDNRTIRFQAGMYRHGYEVAREQGDEVVNPETEKRLTGFADASAKCLQTAPYDPKANPADRCHEEARQRELKATGDHEHQAKHGRAKVRNDEETLAKHGARPTLPEPAWLVALLSALAVGITLTFALHDLVTRKLIDTVDRALIAAGFCATVLAAALVLGIVMSVKHVTAATSYYRWLIAAVLFSGALLLMRLSVAKDNGDYLIALGFAGSELAILIALDHFAAGLRAEWERYRGDMARYTAAEQRVEASRRFLSDRLAELDASRRRLAQYDRQLTEREELLRAAPVIAEAAREAILVGYHHGVAANRGYLNGSDVRPPTHDEIIARLSGQVTPPSTKKAGNVPYHSAPSNGTRESGYGQRTKAA